MDLERSVFVGGFFALLIPVTSFFFTLPGGAAIEPLPTFTLTVKMQNISPVKTQSTVLLRYVASATELSVTLEDGPGALSGVA